MPSYSMCATFRGAAFVCEPQPVSAGAGRFRAFWQSPICVVIYWRSGDGRAVRRFPEGDSPGRRSLLGTWATVSSRLFACWPIRPDWATIFPKPFSFAMTKNTVLSGETLNMPGKSKNLFRGLGLLGGVFPGLGFSRIAQVGGIGRGSGNMREIHRPGVPIDRVSPISLPRRVNLTAARRRQRGPRARTCASDLGSCASDHETHELPKAALALGVRRRPCTAQIHGRRLRALASARRCAAADTLLELCFKSV